MSEHVAVSTLTKRILSRARSFQLSVIFQTTHEVNDAEQLWEPMNLFQLSCPKYVSIIKKRGLVDCLNLNSKSRKPGKLCVALNA